MAIASSRSIALLSVIVIGLCFAVRVNADGFAVCTFQPTMAATDTIKGSVTFQQAESGADVAVVANFTTTYLSKYLYLHVHTWGDLEAGQINNECWTQTTLGPYNAYRAPHHFLSTSLVSGSGINLFGADSIIGRQIAIFYRQSNCTRALALRATPVALCTVGLRNVAGHGVENTAGQYLTETPVGAMAKFVGTVGQYGNNFPNISGRAWFVPTTYSDPITNTSDLVYVRLQISGLKASSRHAVHIHVWGDISGGDGVSAGLHLNPLDQVHGYPPNLIRHMGDLGNVTSDSTGTVYLADFFNLLTFTAASGNIIGRAVIVHTLGDDGNPLLDPTSTGAAGGRLAKSVIGITRRMPTGLDLEAEWVAAGARRALLDQYAEQQAEIAEERNEEQEAAEAAAEAEAAEAAEAAAEAASLGSSGTSSGETDLIAIAESTTTVTEKKKSISRLQVKPSASKTAPGLGALSPA